MQLGEPAAAGGTLTGHTGSHTVAIAILDHPANPGYPTTWHARGYGLFAVNPLGPSIFNPKLPALDLTLEKNQSANFRYRVILFSHAVTAESAAAISPQARRMSSTMPCAFLSEKSVP